MTWAGGLGQAAGTTAKAGILAMVTKVVRDAMATIFSVAFMWTFHGIVRMAPDQAYGLAKKISETYFTPPAEWAGFISEYLNRMCGTDIKLEDITREKVGFGTRSAMEAMGETFLNPMLSLIMPTKEETEVDPMGGAERFISANLQFQMSAWLLHLLGDIQSFGMFKSLKDLPNAISWSYGIGWLSWMVMGPVFRAAITQAMEKKFAADYRYERMTIDQIVDAYYAGVKTKERTYKELSEMAFEDEDIEFLIRRGRKRFTESQMEYLVRKGWKTKNELLEYFRDQGMPEEDADKAAERLLSREGDRIIDKVVSEMEKLYQAGKVSAEELRNYYQEQNLTPEEIELSITELDLETVGKRTLTPAQIARLYQEGHWSKEKALARLEKEYVSTEEAEDFLKLYQPKGA